MAIQDMDICLNVTAEPVVTRKKVSARLGQVIRHRKSKKCQKYHKSCTIDT